MKFIINPGSHVHNHLHQFAIANMVEGVLWVKSNGQICFGNPAIVQLLGCNLEQLTAASIVDLKLVNRIETWQQYWQQIQSQPIVKRIHYGAPNQREYALELSLCHTEIEGEGYCCVIVRDCSEQHAMALELQKAEVRLDNKTQELEEALYTLQDTQLQLAQGEKMSALGNLVAGVAHEINNPIGFLSGNIDHALSYIQALFKAFSLYETTYPENCTALKPKFEQLDIDFIRGDLPKLIESMHEGIRRVQSLSDSLRNFSRADTENKVPAYVHDGVDSTLLILKHRLKANESRGPIEIIRAYGEPTAIQCFPGQLNQVFMNILANAIDAIDEGIHAGQFNHQKAVPQIYVQVNPSDDFESVIIRIRDNGPGMPAEVQARIFERLFTTKEVGKGTGLGLAIAHEIIVETHGGRIEVKSELDVGTEFMIQLPVIDSVGVDVANIL